MDVVVLKPVPAIPFRMLDNRLEKYGLKTRREKKAVVIMGQRDPLLARVRKGETYFELGRGRRVVDVIDALEVEYGVEVVDKNDARYSGKSEDVRTAMSGMVRGEDSIVLAGPTGHPSVAGPFIDNWFRAAELADDAFRNSDIQRMMLDEDGLDLTDYFQFSNCASWLLNRSLREDGSFKINLDQSVQREMIFIMMKAGFLRPAGNHYQMTIPSEVDIAVVEDTVANLLDTAVDREKYGVVTMNLTDARQLAGQLRAQKLAIQRVKTGDRGKVLMLSNYRKDTIKD